jgi:Bacteriophage Mu, Gp27
MAGKGKRAAMEPRAMSMFADGKEIPEISLILGVSQNSLYRWKSESMTPGDDLDLWEKRRWQKRNYLQRARDLLDDQYEYMEGLRAEQRDSKVWDSLSKAFAIVERSEKREKEIRRKAIEEAANTVEETARQQGMDAEQANFWREKVLGIR